jgi:hypothetical protein
MSRRQNELVGKFKMAGGDMVSIRGQVMEYTYIPREIKSEMVRSDVDCDWNPIRGQVMEYTYIPTGITWEMVRSGVDCSGLLMISSCYGHDSLLLFLECLNSRYPVRFT